MTTKLDYLDEKRIAEMKHKGYAASVISKQYNISQRTVYRIVKKWK